MFVSAIDQFAIVFLPYFLQKLFYDYYNRPISEVIFKTVNQKYLLKEFAIILYFQHANSCLAISSLDVSNVSVF